MCVYLCSRSEYMDALRHWMWHHPSCLSSIHVVLWPKLMLVMLSSLKSILSVFVMVDYACLIELGVL